MRSEVVNVVRQTTQYAQPVDMFAGDLLSAFLPEIPVGETKSVRITVEVIEKEEERVGKARLQKHGDGKAHIHFDGFCIRTPSLDGTVSAWKGGQTRDVKSINFETPSGVPEVEFVETPRERLKRAVDGWHTGHLLPFDVATAAQDYLAATEGEK